MMVSNFLSDISALGGRRTCRQTERGGGSGSSHHPVDLIARRDQERRAFPGAATDLGCKASHTILRPVLGTTRLRSGCPRAGLPAEARWRPPRPFQLPGAPRPVPGLVAALLQSLPPSPRLHVASPLHPCLPSSVSYKDPAMGFRPTPSQRKPHLRPFTPSPLQRKDLLSKLSPVPTF